MAKFVTIGGGKIKRAKGRFGGESASRHDRQSSDRCSDLADMQRRLVAADRRFAATALEDIDASDCHDGGAFEHNDVSIGDNEPVRPGTALYNHLFDGRLANDGLEPTSTLTRLVSSRERQRISTAMHNNRKSRTYRDGMRIHSARY